jgi:Predicted membrane protein
VAESRRLDVPRGARGFGNVLRLDPDAVGRFAEGIARFLGTGRFLAVQTVIVIVWIALNVFAVRLQWDPYRSSCSTWPSPPRPPTPRR